jgi:tRNA1(Val) A37 N6-methylase TrmN6
LFERLKAIKDDQAGGRVRFCFGSRKLFRAQFALQANGYEANGYKAVYGKTDEQATLIIGDAAAQIAEQAKLAAKPVVIEKLDFQNKKAELESADRRATRMLSSFAFKKTAASIK